MPRERIRARMPSTVMKSGRGVPPLFNHLINTPPHTDEDEENDEEALDEHWKFLKTISGQWKDPENVSSFQQFCKEYLHLENYPVNLEEGAGLPMDPDKDDEGVDLGVMDPYIQEILLHREIVAEECLAIKKNWELMTDQKARLMSSIARLTRHIYYGTENAYKASESTIPLLVWLLNKSKLPKEIHMLTVKGLSEALFTSKRLKRKFAEIKGTKVLIHCMRDMPRDPELACWACYTLAMAAINSPEIIAQAKKDSHFEDLAREFSFAVYWYNWPVNYGLILRATFYGPQPSFNQQNFTLL